MTHDHIIPLIAWVLFLVILIASPAIIGALSRLFIRKPSPAKLGLWIGVVFVILHSLVSRPFTEMTDQDFLPQDPALHARMANLMTTLVILFQLFLSSTIARIGIFLVDRKRGVSSKSE